MSHSGPIHELRRCGQSPWCDALSRGMIESGELLRLVSGAGITGLTSNPTIFQKALAAGEWYDGDIRAARAAGHDGDAIYERLAVDDIRAAADLLRPVYESTGAGDGFVSLEVSPELAADAAGSVAEARRLHAAVDRANLMIKIPATDAGLSATRTLLGEGISVNVTLIFGLRRYRRVLSAHHQGLLRARQRGVDVGRIASVASFFVSRVDTLVDRMLDERIEDSGSSGAMASMAALRGTAAIDNARLAYVMWRDFVRDVDFDGAVGPGARPQRLLWASTSTKDPAYRDVRYVEELVGPDTVSTMPLETIAAFADHGVVRGATLEEEVEESRRRQAALAEAGIDIEEVSTALEEQGVRLFLESFSLLREQLAGRLSALAAGVRG